MKFTFLTNIILLLTVLSFSINKAQPNISQAETEKFYQAINESREIVKQFMDESKVPGMAAAVSVNGKLIWSEGFGYADLENGIPVTKHTRFRIASISKPITAAALALLYEQGLIDLDEPIQTYLPDFPQKRWVVTLRMLASHQAGVRTYVDDEFLNNKHFDSVSDGVDIFREDTLLFKPGTQYSYSSYGFNLISEVIEKVSGEKFLKFMQRNVFDPLGMNSIIADHTDSLISHRSRFYSLSEDSKILNSTFVDNSNKWAGGGFISNAEDLIKFGNAHLHNRFLREETVKLFTAPIKPLNGEETNYGLGWFSGNDNFGHHWIGHAGGAIGGRSVLIIYPKDNIVVAIATNLGPAKMPVEEAQIISNIFRSNTISEISLESEK